MAGHPILGELAVHRKIRSIARQTENWLRADIYVTAAATSSQMPPSIRRRLLHWVIGALVEALNGIAIEGLPSRSLRPCAHWRVDAGR